MKRIILSVMLLSLSIFASEPLQQKLTVKNKLSEKVLICYQTPLTTHSLTEAIINKSQSVTLFTRSPIRIMIKIPHLNYFSSVISLTNANPLIIKSISKRKITFTQNNETLKTLIVQAHSYDSSQAILEYSRDIPDDSVNDDCCSQQ